jgi:hypothetical protein
MSRASLLSSQSSGSVLSHQSAGSILSSQSTGAFRAHRELGRIPSAAVATGVLAALAAIAVHRVRR